MKKYLVLLFFALSLTVPAQIERGSHILGPSVGLSFLGSTFQIGGNYEYGLDLQDVGLIGVGGIIRYWNYSENYYLGKWNYVSILIGAQGNYYFKLENEKLEPFVGLVLAISSSSVDWEGPQANYSSPSSGGFWLGFQGGARYWLNPSTALAARISFGTLSYGGLEVGVDFKF